MTCGGKSSRAERRIATLTERGEMWAQYNKYKAHPKAACQGKAGETGTV